MNYKLIRTKRKTVSIYIRPGGSVEVRAPLKVSKAYIDSFVASKYDWISSKLAGLEEKKAEKMGVQYEKIKVNKAKTRWGSCNSKGN